MYIFSKNKKVWDLLTDNTSCGSICINDVLMQFSGGGGHLFAFITFSWSSNLTESIGKIYISIFSGGIAIRRSRRKWNWWLSWQIQLWYFHAQKILFDPFIQQTWRITWKVSEIKNLFQRKINKYSTQNLWQRSLSALLWWKDSSTNFIVKKEGITEVFF